MKKKVIKEAGRIANKKIGAKIEGCFFGMLFLFEDGEDAAITFYNGYMNGLVAAGVISKDMAKELQRALAYAAYNEWEPEPEPDISYVLVWKFDTSLKEEVFNWDGDKEGAWRMAKEYERKFKDDIEYMYIEEVEECNLASGWQFYTSRCRK